MPVDLVLNNHTRIQNMSLDKIARFFAEELKVCHKKLKVCPVCTSCESCWRKYLEKGV